MGIDIFKKDLADMIRKVLFGGLISGSLLLTSCFEQTIEEPQPVTVKIGGTATFTVNGSWPYYQWFAGKSPSDMNELEGAMSDTLQLFDVQLSQDSTYIECETSNPSGNQFHGPVLLRVIPD